MSAFSSPGRRHQRGTDHIWRPLRYLNLYRILLASLFVSSFFIDDNLPQLGSHDPHLFIAVSAVYLLLAGIAGFAIHWRWLGFQPLAYGLVVLDIIALTLLMRASGGIASGLGMLLVVAIAGNSLLLGGRTSILFAAIAALSVLVEQVYAQMTQTLPVNYTQAGILGATLFATAFLAHVLSRRIRESEELAARRGVDLANLAQLNQHVIQRMQSGIIVVDAHSRIRLMNESAWHMLGLPPMGGRPSMCQADSFIRRMRLCASTTMMPDCMRWMTCWLSCARLARSTPRRAASSSLSRMRRDSTWARKAVANRVAPRMPAWV